MVCCANYQSEREAFSCLFHLENPTRILFYKGQSGSGKTTLIEHCLDEKPKEIQHIPFTFRPGGSTALAEIFIRTAEFIGWDYLGNFKRTVAEMLSHASASVNKSTQIGSHNAVQIFQILLQTETISQRLEHQSLMTGALFADLKRRPGILLIIFDGFEKASIEVQDWISGPFLGRVAEQKILKVVVTGHALPDQHNIEWGQCCRQYDLWGVVDAKHWIPIIEHKKKCFPPNIKNPMDWLAGVCHALKGNPSEIIKVIDGLPNKDTTI